jgi:hypothetical protein
LASGHLASSFARDISAAPMLPVVNSRLERKGLAQLRDAVIGNAPRPSLRWATDNRMLSSNAKSLNTGRVLIVQHFCMKGQRREAPPFICINHLDGFLRIILSPLVTATL